MSEKYSDLIFRLKQQPRHGQDQAGREKELKDLNRDINNLSNALANNLKLTMGLTDSTKFLTNEHTNLQAGIATSVSIFGRYKTAITNVVKNIDFLGKRNEELNKAFGINSIKAAGLGETYDKLATDLKISGASLRKYAIGFRDLTGGLIANTDKVDKTFQKSILKTTTYIQNRLQLGEEEAQGYELYSAMIANSSAEQIAYQKDLAEDLEHITGLQDVQKTLTETIGKMTADVQMQYSRIPGSLELAVLKSRALGMSMADLHSTGKSLLNIESSIGAELEYQLLSGRRLVGDETARADLKGKSLTNAYREATLMGDASKQADIMNQILKQEGKTLKNNLVARQQMAQLLGMDEGALAKSLQKQELMGKLSQEAQDALFSLEGKDFKQKAMSIKATLDKQGQQAIDELLASEVYDTRTLEQKTVDYLASIDAKMIVSGSATGGGASAVVSDTMVSMTTAGGLFDAKNGPFAPGGTIDTFTTKLTSAAQDLGNLQNRSKAIQESVTAFNGIIENIPLLGAGITKLTTQIDRITQLAGLNTAVAVKEENDALIMNDGVIKFHAQDKFMRVNDSTMIAGTNVDGNKKLARAISGGNGVSKGDLQQLASMIVTAMKGVNLTVSADNTFGSTRLNGIKR